MDRDRAVELATRFFVGVLFVLSAAGLAVEVQSGDRESVLTALFGVYLTGLLLVGVFRNLTDERNWQLAFFGGVALWGSWEYAATGDLFSLLLGMVGVVMVAANVLDLQ